MFIKQISVFLENENGRLRAFTKVLGENNIDMKAICIADTVDFGILRCVVDDPEKTVKVLKENEFTASITNVLAVSLDDTPGGMNRVLKLLEDADIGVDYVYSMLRESESTAMVILKVTDPEKAGSILKEDGVKLFCANEL